MKTDKPPIFTLATELLGWCLDRTAAFPKSQRFTFGQRIDNLALDGLERCIEATYAPRASKRDSLLRLNLDLEKLRIFWRLAAARGWISGRQLLFVSEKIDEIGRMAGGWLRSLQRENEPR